MSKYCRTVHSPTLAPVSYWTLFLFLWLCLPFSIHIYMVFWLQLTSGACPVSKWLAAEYHLSVCLIVLNCTTLGRLCMTCWNEQIVPIVRTAQLLQITRKPNPTYQYYVEMEVLLYVPYKWCPKLERKQYCIFLTMCEKGMRFNNKSSI